MAAGAKVVPIRANPLPMIGMASVASTGRLIPGSRNEVWLCQAYDAGGGAGLVLYVKPGLTPRALLIEALAAQVGQCIGLPCPTPYIVTSRPQFLGRPRGANVVAFGSVQVGSSGLARPIHDLNFMMSMLQRFKVDHTAAAFDEWIANPVRGPGDVMFDPQSGPAFIDHEGAMDPLTASDASVTNWLAARLVERVADDKRRDLLKAVHALLLRTAPS